MSTFAVPIELGDRAGERWERLEALVDTGASYSSIPGDILERLGVQLEFERDFVTADGRVIQRPLGLVLCRLDGEQIPILAVSAEPEAPPLLGAHALEAFALAVDPLGERLVPRRLYLL